MATTAIYSQYDTTIANLIPTLKTHILASTDWTNITGDIMKSTANSGSQLVVNLSKGVIDSHGLTVSFFRTHDGTTGVDESPTRYVKTRSNTAGASTDPVHVTVSASKDHLMIALEGPRTGEVASGDGNISSIDCLILCDVTRYDTVLDPNPFVFAMARPNNGSVTNNNVPYSTGMVSQNRAVTAPWTACLLGTVQQPRGARGDTPLPARQSDGSYTLFPYLVFGDREGLRGRLVNVYFGGSIRSDDTGYVPDLGPGEEVTYGGQPFVGSVPMRSGNSGSGFYSTTALWRVNESYNNNQNNEGPLVMVPYQGALV